MVPSTCTTNFISTHFYWHVWKFYEFWVTPNIHIIDHIGKIFPCLTNFSFFFMITYCPQSLNLIMTFIFWCPIDWIYSSETHGCHVSKFSTHGNWPKFGFLKRLSRAYTFSGSRDSSLADSNRFVLKYSLKWW